MEIGRQIVCLLGIQLTSLNPPIWWSIKGSRWCHTMAESLVQSNLGNPFPTVGKGILYPSGIGRPILLNIHRISSVGTNREID